MFFFIEQQPEPNHASTWTALRKAQLVMHTSCFSQVLQQQDFPWVLRWKCRVTSCSLSATATSSYPYRVQSVVVTVPMRHTARTWND
jgi:hypothetical protein